MATLARPELHDGRLLWINRDIVDKINNGDPLLGWEGDDRLGVFLEQEDPPVWAIYRHEENDLWTHVVRTEPGIPFDERVIHWLVNHDNKHRTIDLDKIVREANAKRDEERAKTNNEYIAEELAPRLQAALRKDHGW